MPISYGILAFLVTTRLVSATSLVNPALHQVDINHTLNDIAVVREYFYVGGHYSDDGSGTGEHIFKEQMYIEKLSADPCGKKKPYPIVFIHGQGQTGTNWLNKPDGSPGWSSYFLSQGYTVYLLDQTFRARSPWQPLNGTLNTYSAEVIQKRFTAPERYNIWPQASLHTQWPGTGVMGDPYFDAYYSSNVQFINSATYQQSTVQAAGADLLDLIGSPVILLSHSQGGTMPWLIADARPDLVMAILSVEPTGPPFEDVIFANNTPARAYGLTDIPITYDPPVSNPKTELARQTILAPSYDQLSCVIQADPPRTLANLVNIPVLVVTTESSFHAQYDWCNVQYLQQAGVNAAHLELGAIGIHGNGHLVFLEKNSNEVAGVLLQWLDTIENGAFGTGA